MSWPVTKSKLISYKINKISHSFLYPNRTEPGLVSHGVIPDNELWVKLGGDKGHGSFKLNFQLCNVTHPNSQKNTTLLAMCMAGDNTTNLHIALDQYKEQMEEMEGMDLGYFSLYAPIYLKSV